MPGRQSINHFFQRLVQSYALDALDWLAEAWEDSTVFMDATSHILEEAK